MRACVRMAIQLKHIQFAYGLQIIKPNSKELYLHFIPKREFFSLTLLTSFNFTCISFFVSFSFHFLDFPCTVKQKKKASANGLSYLDIDLLIIWAALHIFAKAGANLNWQVAYHHYYQQAPSSINIFKALKEV